MATLPQRTSLRKYQHQLYEFLSTKRMMALITLAPAGGLFLLVFIGPVSWIIWVSFHDVSAYSPEMTWVGLENYAALLKDPLFLDSIGRSTVWAVSSVLFQLITGVGLALLVNRRFKFKRTARTITMLPYMVSNVAMAYFILWIFNSTYGILNEALLSLSIVDAPVQWFASTTLAMPSLIVGSSWRFSIFVTILVLARLQNIPASMYESARVNGASAFRQFRDITLPHIRNVVLIAVLLRGVWMFNKYDIIWITTKGGPNRATEVAGVYAYKTGFLNGNFGLAAAISVVLFGLLAIAAIIYFAVFNPEEEVAVE